MKISFQSTFPSIHKIPGLQEWIFTHSEDSTAIFWEISKERSHNVLNGFCFVFSSMQL